jgi:predicted enzyme related to lactoylglutathione lyase
VPERTEYAPGTPCWLDLAAPDMDEAKSFYGGLFGWEAQTAPGPEEETRGYSFFTLNGKTVAGFGPPGPDEPPSWRTYVSVADADETAGKVKDAGGEVLFDPLDVMEVGRMAVFRDTEGAVICAWQANQFAGAQVVNEPGALSWNELATRDLDAAKSFYSAVFGWEAAEQDMGDIPYVMLQVDDHPVGGMLPLTDDAPDEVSPHWLAYFVVEAFDDAVEKARELGGEVKGPESDTPAGKIGILSDPAGAGFAVIELSDQSQEDEQDEEGDEDGVSDEDQYSDS